jgi:hypothetical protein
MLQQRADRVNNGGRNSDRKQLRGRFRVAVVFGLLDRLNGLRVRSLSSRLPGTTEGVAFVGSTRHSPSNPTQASGSPCPPPAIPSPLPLALALMLSPRHQLCHPLPTSLRERAAFRSPADRMLALAVCRPEIGCRIPQPISAGSRTPEAWQIEYPRSVPGRPEIPSHGNWLQRTAALKELGRPVYL